MNIQQTDIKLMGGHRCQLCVFWQQQGFCTFCLPVCHVVLWFYVYNVKCVVSCII